MSAVTFDTLKFVETLESAGFERAHASAVAAAVRDSHANADVATKADVSDLRKDTDSQFSLLRKDLEAQSNKITIRVAGAVITVLLALEVINRFWPKV